jgi:hypothetical protein
MIDIAVIESLNGGEIQVLGNDLATVDGLENMPYLAWFGGNVGQSTKKKLSSAEQNFDWWGNNLLFFNEPSFQFNSLFENTIKTMPLTSSGRAAMEQAANLDLAFLSPVAEYTVTVTYVTVDRIRMQLWVRMRDGSNTFTKDISFSKKESDGDWLFDDFNDDFFTSE